MAASVISTETLSLGANADPSAASITIPATCTAAYFFWEFYAASGGILTAVIDGSGYDEIIEVSASGAENATGCVAFYSPSTGSQTIDVEWDSALIYGPVAIIVYVKDGDTTAWRNGQTDAEQSTTTPGPLSITSTTTDLVLGLHARDGTTAPTLDASGWTSHATQVVNGSAGRLKSADSPGASSTSLVATATHEYDTLVGISIPAGATAPVLSLPTETSISYTTATIGCTTDEAAGTLYYFVSTSATPPSAAALKAGTGATKSGSQASPGVGTETFALTGLSAGTTYYSYFIHTDGASPENDSSILESGSWATDSVVLSLPTEAAITDTTATIGCTTDTAAGTLYYYVSTSATPPSVANLKSGSGATKSGSQATPGIGVETFALTGLTAETNYYNYFLQTDSGTDSTILESGIWSTSAEPGEPTPSVFRRRSIGYV